MAEKTFIIDPTNFIFNTNFTGDPSADNFGSRSRYGNIIIPDQAMADELANIGVRVKMTKPTEDYDSTYFVKALASFNGKYPPEIYLVAGNAAPERLTEETIHRLDHITVDHIRVAFQPCWLEKYSVWVVYIQHMYVHQGIDRDPFAASYN